MKRALMVFGILMIGIVILTGCGQQTPSISTSSSQPKGLTIRGVIYGANIDGNRANPLSGVVMYLSGDQVNRVTTTNANGEYSFTDLPSNNTGSSSLGYNIVATKEGYQRTIVSGLNFGSVIGSPIPDNSVLTYDIDMDGDPVVLSISPTPGTTIEAAAQTIAVAFNEAMDPSSVRPTLTSQGMRTFAIADTQTLTTAWSADSKILYITTGALLANQTYQLQVDPSNIAKDASGFRLETYPTYNSGGVDSTSYNAISTSWPYPADPNKCYRTASGGVLGAPSNISVTLNSLLPSDADFSDVITGGSIVKLHWDTPASGQITGYRVYTSLSSAGPWNLLDTYGSNQSSKTVSDINTSLFGTSLVDPVCYNTWAFENNKVYFKVVAFNGEGESSAATAEAQEGVGPQLNANAQEAPCLGEVLNNNYYLPKLDTAEATDKQKVYIAFNQPIDASSVAATKFTISGGVSVEAVNVMTQSSSDLGLFAGDDFAILLVSTDTDLTLSGPRTLEVTGVKDLAGNPVTATVGDTVIIP